MIYVYNLHIEICKLLFNKTGEEKKGSYCPKNQFPELKNPNKLFSWFLPVLLVASWFMRDSRPGCDFTLLFLGLFCSSILFPASFSILYCQPQPSFLVSSSPSYEVLSSLAELSHHRNDGSIHG